MKPKQALIWIDQGFNVLFGGWADETISARAYRCSSDKRHWMITKHIIDVLFFWQIQHCMQSYVSEIKRYQMPPHYRDEIDGEEHV